MGSIDISYLLDDDLLVLAKLKHPLFLVRVEPWRQGKEPLGGLFSEVPDDDWLLSHVLDWTVVEIKDVGEVYHGSFPDCDDRHQELLSLGLDYQVIVVIDFGFRAESYYEGDVHARGHFVPLKDAVRVVVVIFRRVLARLYVMLRDHLKQTGVRLDDLDPPRYLVSIPQLKDLLLYLKWLEIGELDQLRLGLEDRDIDGDYRIGLARKIR